YREYSGVVHLILRETVEPSGIGTAALQQALGPKVRKSIVAIDENHGFLKELKLDIGNPLNRTDPALLDVPEEAFEDLSDDFLQLPPAAFSFQGRSLGDTYQREFFAVGDYGIIQFAELIEVTTLRFAPAALAPTVVPAVPAAATATATAFAPVFAGVLAGVLALAMFANRRKNPAAALAKMKK
ncbi:MAG TPA: hypothetical protein VFH47_00305, partial [Candidatus Thermoplasmatota archaeon]|nr:hypothetical protein [Candidatus Thermoplasmatota archaeon]